MGNWASAANLLLYFVHIGLPLSYLVLNYLVLNSICCHFINLGSRCGELHSYSSLACMAVAFLQRLTGYIHWSRGAQICIHIYVCLLSIRVLLWLSWSCIKPQVSSYTLFRTTICQLLLVTSWDFYTENTFFHYKFNVRYYDYVEGCDWNYKGGHMWSLTKESIRSKLK